LRGPGPALNGAHFLHQVATVKCESYSILEFVWSEARWGSDETTGCS
jgi:hypothetical protein